MWILCAVIIASPVARAVLFYLKVPNGGFGNLLTSGDNLATGCLIAVLGLRFPKFDGKQPR
jgi:hypothetical protein